MNINFHDRLQNKYSANCSVCKAFVLEWEGFLYKNTKYSNSKGYHVKCKGCHTGENQKQQQKEDRQKKEKTLSLVYAKKWCESLTFKIQQDCGDVWCDVIDPNGEILLGFAFALNIGQEYPSYCWCESVGRKIGGVFSDRATEYIIETVTQRIESENSKAISV